MMALAAVLTVLRNVLTLLLAGWTVWDAMFAVSLKLGWVGYVVGLLVSALFAPTALFLPWFDAWLHKTTINPVLLTLWIVTIGAQVVTGIVTGAIAKRLSREFEREMR